ncbi:hypothetical protein [Glutamicibacter protophormiae]|uniref:hypothetical protein n=1 Tax=Glutamicibacter protophormiae TaxID=37930 RepID=UPI0019581AA6|nr:hypothetical protein [Glutamicibacter protophormiae]QRQ79096.1 hypothetical protein JQN66_02235 [Glutamicibacter protophormiae]
MREAKKAKQAQQIYKASTEVFDVVVRCPETDNFFPTGVACDAGSFNSGSFENNRTQCPHCGKMHRWGDSEIALAN